MIYNTHDIKGYELVGTELISHKGKASKVLGKRHDKDGYVTINVRHNKKCLTIKEHRLIAQHYIPNPNNYPQVDHINGIRNDNRVENLRWCSHQQNTNFIRFVNRGSTNHLRISKIKVRGRWHYRFSMTYRKERFQKASYDLTKVLCFKFITILKIKSKYK